MFVGTDGDNLAVDFDLVGRVSLKRETWEKRSRSGAVVASRRQFPVTLAYGITCHRSQSSTISAAVVHCSKEFTPGLIYVACSRVKTSQHLQVLHFSSDQLLKPSQDCLDVCASHKPMATSADNCCVQSELTENELVINERLQEVDETGADDEENQEMDDVTQKLVNGYFERKEEPDKEENFDLMEDTEDDLDLEDISMSLMSEGGHVLSTPPESFDIKKILKEMKVPLPVAERSTGSAKSKNETIDGQIMIRSSCLAVFYGLNVFKL